MKTRLTTRSLLSATMVAPFILGGMLPLHAQPDTWQQKADFANGPSAEPSARFGAVGFTVGGKGYIGTGNDGARRKDFWEYDPGTDTWAQKADFGGTAREYAVGFGIGSKGYLGTGYDGTYRKDFWEYDPGANAWTQVADLGGAARARATGFAVGSEGYVGTGYNGSHRKDFWAYDPGTDTWTAKSDFGGTARSFAVGFGIGATGYIGTGNDGVNKKDFWAYDPGTDTWSPMADFGGTARNGAAGFSTSTKGYIGTGFASNYTADLWEYDPVGDTWTQKAGLGAAIRSGATGFAIGGTGYICTGWNGDVMDDCRAYDPGTDTWSAIASFSGTARGYSFSFSAGGKGYVGAGWNGSFRKDLWEYDPVLDAWAQKADFGGAARTHAVGFAIGNKGYAGTGWAGSYTKDFWEYDPGTNTWTQKADFGGVARYAATGFAIGGKGYIGTGSSGSNRKDFWEYDPGTDAWTQKADFGGVARYGAVGFAVAGRGFIGTGTTGSNRKDFWEYDPGADAWTRNADFGGTARYAAIAFASGTKAYVGLGNDGANRKDFWEYDPVNDTWKQRNDFDGAARMDAIGFHIGGMGYVGTGRSNRLYNDLWAYEPFVCTGDQVVVRVTTDNAPTAITWEIIDASLAVVASGGYGSGRANRTVADTVCLNALPTSAWYGFKLMDGNGDGITGGGWELRTTDGKVILRDEFGTGASSPANPPLSGSYGSHHSFALPLAAPDVHPAECGVFNNRSDNKVFANKVAGTNYLGGTLNYQFEFSDPDSGYVRRIKKPRNYVVFSELNPSPLKGGKHYFTRVRTDKAGPVADAHWGAGCEMGLGTTVNCTQLIESPTYGHSCNETRRYGPSSFIYAQPVFGASQYEFRIFNTGEGYDETYVRNTYILELNGFANPLLDGFSYQVQVRARVSDTWGSYCGTCSVTIDNQQQMNEHLVQAAGEATLWPNPARDGQVYLNIDGIEAATQQITVDVKDIYGQQVYGQAFGNSGERFSTVLDLPADIASGVYMVNITVNGEVTTKRLSIVR